VGVGEEIANRRWAFDGVFFEEFAGLPHAVLFRGGFSHGEDIFLRDGRFLVSPAGPYVAQ